MMASGKFTLQSLPNIFSRGHRWSQREYYAYRLYTRGDEALQTLHRSKRLFEEFIVDAYAQTEQNRLRWVRMNQDALRVDLYKGLCDAVAESADLHDIRQRRILLASFTGGPQSMYRYYHDSMAIIRHSRKLDLFITITCNPK